MIINKMSAKICRICGNRANLKNILEVENTEELLEKLELCVNIRVCSEDYLPKYICEQCNEGVELSYRLRKMGEETERILKLETETLKEISEQKVDTQSNEYLEKKEEANACETGDIENIYDHTYEVDGDYIDYESLIEEDADELAIFDGITIAKEQKPEEDEDTLTNHINTLVKYTTNSCEQQHRQNIKEEQFNCVECQKLFPTRNSLRKHENCHRSAVELYECKHCDRSYRVHCNLMRHIRIAHELQRRYKCSKCEESFGRSDVLKNHMLTHVEDRNFKCLRCVECFKSKRYLDSHMKTHERKMEKASTQRKLTNVQKSSKSSICDKRLYNCSYCGKISKHHFTHKNHLRVHTQERPFTCDTCSKSFRTQSALIIHIRTHTDERPHKCFTCSASFRQRSHLKEHMLIHEGKAPHVCSICNVSFVKKSNMQVHMRMHTGERPYKCVQCDQQFTKFSLLSRHASAVHKTTIKWDRRHGMLAEANRVSLDSEENLKKNVDVDDVLINVTDISSKNLRTKEIVETDVLT